MGVVSSEGGDSGCGCEEDGLVDGMVAEEEDDKEGTLVAATTVSEAMIKIGSWSNNPIYIDHVSISGIHSGMCHKVVSSSSSSSSISLDDPQNRPNRHSSIADAERGSFLVSKSEMNVCFVQARRSSSCSGIAGPWSSRTFFFCFFLDCLYVGDVVGGIFVSWYTGWFSFESRLDTSSF